MSGRIPCLRDKQGLRKIMLRLSSAQVLALYGARMTPALQPDTGSLMFSFDPDTPIRQREAVCAVACPSRKAVGAGSVDVNTMALLPQPGAPDS